MRSTRFSVWLSIVPILGLLWAHAAGAALIYSEGFNTNGAGTRYTVTGGGSSGGTGDPNYWARQTTVPTPSPAFAGREGADFWTGRDLDEAFGGGGLRRVQLNSQSLAGYTGVTVSILLAANTGVWDGSQATDVMRLYAVNATTGAATLLDTFLPVSAADSNLRSAVHGATLGTLGLTFVRYTYTVPVAIGNVAFRFEANSSGDLEYIGFDDIRIEGTVVVPEPAPLAALCLGLGILGLIGRRTKQAQGQTITLP